MHLMVFDIRGRKVQDLYKGYKTKGHYAIKWNAKKYASGIYFVNMRTDNFIQTQKMTLIK